MWQGREHDLPSVARDIISTVRKESGEGASVLALIGDLGAGKTTFVKALAAELGVSSEVRSPTFVIEQVYDLEQDQLFEQLIHIDAYRLENGDELTRLGWQKQVDDPGNLIIVEWAEHVKDVMPANAMWLQFEVVDEHKRAISQM